MIKCIRGHIQCRKRYFLTGPCLRQLELKCQIVRERRKEAKEPHSSNKQQSQHQQRLYSSQPARHLVSYLVLIQLFSTKHSSGRLCLCFRVESSTSQMTIISEITNICQSSRWKISKFRDCQSQIRNHKHPSFEITNIKVTPRSWLVPLQCWVSSSGFDNELASLTLSRPHVLLFYFF